MLTFNFQFDLGLIPLPHHACVSFSAPDQHAGSEDRVGELSLNSLIQLEKIPEDIS